MNGTLSQLGACIHRKEGRQRCNAFVKIHAHALSSIRDVLSLHGYVEVPRTLLFEITRIAKNPFYTFPITYSPGSEALPQSSQIQLEVLSSVLDHNCFTVANSFSYCDSADPERDTPQLQEVSLVELEVLYEKVREHIAYDKLLCLLEELVKYVIKEVVENCHPELFTLQTNVGYLRRILRKSFVRIRHEDALELVRGESVSNGRPLEQHEYDKILEHFCCTPVLLTHLPSAQTLFNVKRVGRGSESYSTRLLVPKIGQIANGAVHEENTQIVETQFSSSELSNQVKLLRLDPLAPLQNYFSLLKGPANGLRAGLSISFDQLLRFLIGKTTSKESRVSFL